MNSSSSKIIHNQKRNLSTTDLLFTRLDRQRVTGRAVTWMTEILGVFVEGTEAWVQIARAGHPATSVLVRVSPKDGVDRVIAALRAWTDFPLDNRPAVLDLRVTA